MGTEANVDNIKISLEDICSPDEGRRVIQEGVQGFLSHCLKGTQVKNPTGDYELGSSWQRPGRKEVRREVCVQQQGDEDVGLYNLSHPQIPKTTSSCLNPSPHILRRATKSPARHWGYGGATPRRWCWASDWMDGLPPWLWETCALFWHCYEFVSQNSPVWESMKWDHSLISFVMRQNSIDSRDRPSLKLSSTIYQMCDLGQTN